MNYGPIHRQPWQHGCDGHGTRVWFAYRKVSGHPRGNPSEYHERDDGRIRRYASAEAAARVADRLNRAEGLGSPLHVLVAVGRDPR